MMTNKRGGIAAVAWDPHSPRTEQYAQRLGASLYQIHYLLYKRPFLAPIKYIPQCLKTWFVLYRQRPFVVYVAISPVFAALSVYVYCRLAGVPYVMDIHGHSFTAKKWAWTLPLQRFLAQQSLATIVDQVRYKELLKLWGVKVVMLERPPLNILIPESQQDVEFGQPRVTVVSTFSSDEPLKLVLGAARQLPNVRFFILGDITLAKKSLLRGAPANVVFPGYLLGDDYWRQLHNSQTIMALTTAPYSLLGGAQEGLSLGKPLILSRQPALVDYFTKGVVFIDHSVESMAAGVKAAQEQNQRLTQEITELAKEKRERWETEFQKLWGLIEDE